MSRETLEALASVQQQNEWLQRRTASLEAQVMELARLAGADAHIAKLVVKADVDNPAQPWPSPGAEAPEETTEEALAGDSTNPVKRDQPAGGNPTDLNTPGAVPGATDVAADATTTVDSIGTDVNTPAFNEDQDVTKPVAGTEERAPIDQVRIETDVRTREGDYSNAFPIEPDGGFAEQKSTTSLGSVRVAALRLAKLRMQAGIADSDDEIVVMSAIEATGASDEVLEAEIKTLSQVLSRTATRRGPAPDGTRHLVPRVGSTTQRSAPPLHSDNELVSVGSLGEHEVVAHVEASEFLFE